jgi:hypothetical protein
MTQRIYRAVKDYAAQKAIEILERRLISLENRVGRLFQNETIVVSSGAQPLTVSATEPAITSVPAWWYKPGNPGNLYGAVEDSAGNFIWTGPVNTGDIGA